MHIDQQEKAGLILGLTTAAPAFLCLFFGVDEPEAAFAALCTGIVVSIVCGSLSKKFARAGSAVLILWWVGSGVVVGIAEAVAATVTAAAPMQQGEYWVAGMIFAVGAPPLGMLGAVTGAIIAKVLYFQ